MTPQAGTGSLPYKLRTWTLRRSRWTFPLTVDSSWLPISRPHCPILIFLPITPANKQIRLISQQTSFTSDSWYDLRVHFCQLHLPTPPNNKVLFLIDSNCLHSTHSRTLTTPTPPSENAIHTIYTYTPLSEQQRYIHHMKPRPQTYQNMIPLISSYRLKITLLCSLPTIKITYSLSSYNSGIPLGKINTLSSFVSKKRPTLGQSRIEVAKKRAKRRLN